MLPRRLRMVDGAEFTATVRHGRRIGGRTMVLHLRRTSDSSTRIGFVVSKSVGNAVTRNRVKRRLRHLVAEQLNSPVTGDDPLGRSLAGAASHARVAGPPVGARMVIRALPAAAAEPDLLARDFARAWNRASREQTS